jgi:hypothetical protein
VAGGACAGVCFGRQTGVVVDSTYQLNFKGCDIAFDFGFIFTTKVPSIWPSSKPKEVCVGAACQLAEEVLLVDGAAAY